MRAKTSVSNLNQSNYYFFVQGKSLLRTRMIMCTWWWSCLYSRCMYVILCYHFLMNNKNAPHHSAQAVLYREFLELYDFLLYTPLCIVINYCPLLVHFKLWLPCIHRSLGVISLYVDTCGKLVYVVVFVVFIICVGTFFFASETYFVNQLNTLNHVRICTPYNAPRDLQKQDRLIARFSCYFTKTNPIWSMC